MSKRIEFHHFVGAKTVFLTAILVAAQFGPTSGAGAEIYQWTDESGQTAYGEHPPADTDAQAVDLPPPPVSDEVAKKELDAFKNKQKAYTEEVQKGAGARKEATATAATKKKNCEMATEHANALQINRRYVDENGTFVDDGMRLKRLEAAKKAMAENC